MRIAKLDTDQLNTIQALEKEIGATIMAMEENTKYTQLNETQLKKLKEIEAKNKLILLAMK